MTPKIIAIAGGTGAGKSTVAFALRDKYPDKISIVHLDDYHPVGARRAIVPMMAGMQNWDHPEALEWDALIVDLKKIKHGETLNIQSKNDNLVERSQDENIEEKETPRFPVTIEPRPIIILEGYLSLWHPELREMLDYSFFLDVPHDTRIKRRTKFLNPDYEQKILIPMHEQYVEPTKEFANNVINIESLSLEDVVKQIEIDIMKEVAKT